MTIYQISHDLILTHAASPSEPEIIYFQQEITRPILFMEDFDTFQ